MALGMKLGEAKLVPQSLEIKATVTLDEVDGVPTIVSSKIAAKARVEGADAAGFAAVVEEAAQLCPVSRLFAGAEVTVDAELVGD
jgi:osmotically inducible protein OsmC